MTVHMTGIPDIDYPSDGLDFFDRMYQAGAVSKSLDVMAYLYRHASPEDGYIFATYKKIQDATGVSAPTISAVLKRLQDAGAIKKVGNGIWQLKISSQEGEPCTFIRREA